MSAAALALEGRCALITGATRGLGLEIARHYLQAGASVALCGRDAAALAAALTALRPLALPGRSVLGAVADVTREADVNALLDGALAHFGRLDVLVNNAGIGGPVGPTESVEWAEWVRAVEINLFAPVRLCRAVVPHFRRGGGGKIIQLSGGGATRALPMLSAYAAAKAAVVRFVETLAEELRSDHIDVNALAPGTLATRLLDELLAAGPGRLGPQLHERLAAEKRAGAVPLARGAQLAVFLGSAASDGITGRLISAVWDPWASLPRHRGALGASDVYTLRRIEPKDRGLTFEDEP